MGEPGGSPASLARPIAMSQNSWPEKRGSELCAMFSLFLSPVCQSACIQSGTHQYLIGTAMRLGLDPARYSPKAPAGVIGTDVSGRSLEFWGQGTSKITCIKCKDCNVCSFLV